MAKRIKRDISRVAAKYCDDFDLDYGGSHIIVTLRTNGLQRKISAGSSPSCKHFINQFERDVRKAVKEMKAGLPAGTNWANREA